MLLAPISARASIFSALSPTMLKMTVLVILSAPWPICRFRGAAIQRSLLDILEVSSGEGKGVTKVAARRTGKRTMAMTCSSENPRCSMRSRVVMIRHGAPVPRRASVGRMPAAAYRSIVDMDWSRMVAASFVDSVGGRHSSAPRPLIGSRGPLLADEVCMGVTSMARRWGRNDRPSIAF